MIEIIPPEKTSRRRQLLCEDLGRLFRDMYCIYGEDATNALVPWVQAAALLNHRAQASSEGSNGQASRDVSIRATNATDDHQGL